MVACFRSATRVFLIVSLVPSFCLTARIVLLVSPLSIVRRDVETDGGRGEIRGAPAGSENLWVGVSFKPCPPAPASGGLDGFGVQRGAVGSCLVNGQDPVSIG